MLHIQPRAALVAATGARALRGLTTALKVLLVLAIGIVCVDLCFELSISVNLLMTDAAAICSEILRSLH